MAFDSCVKLESIEIPATLTSIKRQSFYKCSALTTVYYGGTSEQWDNITIHPFNDPLQEATRYYYSETPNYDGAHWHYVDGIPAVWEK